MGRVDLDDTQYPLKQMSPPKMTVPVQCPPKRWKPHKMFSLVLLNMWQLSLSTK